MDQEEREKKPKSGHVLSKALLSVLRNYGNEPWDPDISCCLLDLHETSDTLSTVCFSGIGLFPTPVIVESPRPPSDRINALF